MMTQSRSESMTPEEYQARGERLAAAQRAHLEALLALTCPHCGSGDVSELFDPSADWFACETCSQPFEVKSS